MTPTITTWVNMEKTSFTNFNDFVASLLEDGIFRSLTEKMTSDIAAKKSSTVALPWGTYSADVKAVGETGNITPTFEPSKLFKKMLNDDSTVSHDLHQEVFDSEYRTLLKNYVAYGTFYPDPANDTPAVDKGLRLNDDEVDYFLNEYLNVLVTIAKDKQRSGKSYRLEIDETYPHGSFDFEYADDDKGDSITVKFIPSKAFKQALKNDEIAGRVRSAEFTEAAAANAVRIQSNARRARGGMSWLFRSAKRK